MPQQPTDGKPIEVLKEYHGLNDNSDSVRRPPGTVTSNQNVIDSQAGDANRRSGRIMQSLQDGEPIGVIYNLTWRDGSINTIQLAGNSFQFEAPTYSQVNGVQESLENPCPETEPTSCPSGYVLTTNATTGIDYCANATTGEPLCPVPNPTEAQYIPPAVEDESIPDFVPIIRALAEAYYFAKKALDNTITIPSRTVVVDFYEVPSNPNLDPILRVSGVNNSPQFIDLSERGLAPIRSGSQSVKPTSPYTEAQLNFYYIDYAMLGSSRWVTDLNLLINTYNTQVLTLFLKTDPDSSTAPATFSNYTSADYYVNIATASNYRTVCAQFAGFINSRLSRVKVSTTQSVLETKTGTAQDSIVGCSPNQSFMDTCSLYGTWASSYSISGWTTSTFQSPQPGCGCGQTSSAPSLSKQDLGGGNVYISYTGDVAFFDTSQSCVCLFSGPTMTICYSENPDCSTLLWLLWVGLTGDNSSYYYKTGGTTPAGTYTQSSSGDLTAPATITLI